MEQKSSETRTTKQEQTTELSDAELKAAQNAGKTALENANNDELDDLLADIDDILEENAQDFVNDFVQKGGQ